MDKYENRRRNLQALLDERCEGKAAILANKIERSPSYVSRMLYPEGKAGKKGIGEDIADVIEAAFNLPKGELDTPPEQFNPSGDGVSSATVQTIDDLPRAARVTVGFGTTDVIPVRVVNLRVQAGFPRFEADEIFDDEARIDLPRQWLEENQLVPNCLLAIKVRGPSMEPMFFEDDIIVINIADNKPVTGQVYVVNYDGNTVVKQMVYRNREWWLHSFNQDDEFKPLMARSGNAQIIGKVVYRPGTSMIGKL